MESKPRESNYSNTHSHHLSCFESSFPSTDSACWCQNCQNFLFFLSVPHFSNSSHSVDLKHRKCSPSGVASAPWIPNNKTGDTHSVPKHAFVFCELRIINKRLRQLPYSDKFSSKLHKSRGLPIFCKCRKLITTRYEAPLLCAGASDSKHAFRVRPIPVKEFFSFTSRKELFL